MAYDITGARLNGPRKRINKIARAAVAELLGTSVVHSRAGRRKKVSVKASAVKRKAVRRPKASVSRKAGRRTTKSARRNPVSALLNPLRSLGDLAFTAVTNPLSALGLIENPRKKRRKAKRKASAAHAAPARRHARRKAKAPRLKVRRTHRRGGREAPEPEKDIFTKLGMVYDPFLKKQRPLRAGDESRTDLVRHFLPVKRTPSATANNNRGLAHAVTNDLFSAMDNPRKRKASARSSSRSVSDAQISSVVKKFVGQFNKSKSLSHEQKMRMAPALFQRNDGKIFGQLLGKHALKAGSATTRLLRQRVKRAVAKELGIPATALQGKGRHYKVKDKKVSRQMKGAFGRGVTAVGRAVPRKPVGMRASEWYKKIGGKAGYRRAYEKSDFGKYKAARVLYRQGASGFDKKSHKWKSKGKRTSGAILAGDLSSIYAELGVSGPHIGGGRSKAKKSASTSVRKGRRQMSPWQSFVKDHPGVPFKELSRMYKKRRGARRNVSALQNPGSALGTSALMNPVYGGTFFGNAKEYAVEYALPVVAAGAAAGYVHSFAASKGWTESLAGTVAKVPVVGTFASERLPYTVQGAVVGGALALLSPMVGGQVGKYLALVGGTALAVGGGLDAFNFVHGAESEGAASDLEAEAAADATGALAFGDLAFERALGDADFGDLGFGDLAFEGKTNPFQAASLSAPALGQSRGDELAAMYSQSSFADAYHSGADFSAVEGQALLNGSDAWCKTFGNPSVRMAGKSTETASHHAGREGHRWGWLIRCLGTERARRIAALPPAQRLRVLAKIRKAAIRAYDAAMRAEKAAAQKARPLPAHAPAVLPAAGAVTNGALGAMGPGAANMDYLGDPVVFMGA